MGRSFKWEAVGARYELDDRSATTVFYESAKGARAAYTILRGDKILVPAGAPQKDEVRGEALHLELTVGAS